METRTEYIIRHADTKEPVLRYSDERTAVNMAGLLNKRAGREKMEILKRVITVETSVL